VPEAIESDLARLEANTQATETSVRNEYDIPMIGPKVDKTAKTKDIDPNMANTRTRSRL